MKIPSCKKKKKNYDVSSVTWIWYKKRKCELFIRRMKFEGIKKDKKKSYDVSSMTWIWDKKKYELFTCTYIYITMNVIKIWRRCKKKYIYIEKWTK